eukprot:CAMPEP_0198216760 /NCGR_PEP_ID=MMETSP1445-20131203/59508_1 /TAXON_ID=36898 /ORGANISM="Pyramimonas sp., Strain CCMP2087" /LENGTH=38 /DNA_ID= /DNA_START= /DNA_END= /DNA_ORIENTATION=
MEEHGRPGWTDSDSGSDGGPLVRFELHDAAEAGDVTRL